MKSLERKRVGIGRTLCGMILFAALFLLCRTFPIVGDDWFREALGASLHNPIDLLREVASRWATVNGRILGNILSYSAGSRPLPREGMRALFILALAWLLSDVARLEGWPGLLWCGALVLSLPQGMFAQIYPWAAGFFNYVPPVVMLLACLELVRPVLDGSPLEEHPGRCAALFLLGFGQQLFVENNTLYALCASAVLLVWYRLERHKWSPGLLAFFLGCALGAALLFASPSYRLVGAEGGAYQSGLGGGLAGLLSTAQTNLPEVAKYYILDCPVLYWSLTLLPLLLWWNGGKRAWKDGLLAAVLVLGCLDLAYIRVKPMAAAVVWGAALTAALWRWSPNRACRAWTLFLWLSAPVAAGPLLFVSPIGSRCLFLSYVLLLAAAAVMFRALEPGRWLGPLAAVALLGLFAGCFSVFLPLHRVELQRTQAIQNAISSGAHEVAVPAYHDGGWLWDADNALKMEAYFYRNEPGDLTIRFTP